MIMRATKIWLMLLLLVNICLVGGSPPTRKIELPLLEEQAVGSEVHDLMEDPSMDGRAGVSFKLMSQEMKLGSDVVDDVTEWVALNENTGVISVATPVDREKYCNQDRTKQCVVRVEIIRQPQSTLQWFEIDLNVIDINDHAPAFPVRPIITLNISEDSPVRSRINLDRFLATDADRDSNSMIYYRLSHSKYFSVHGFSDKITGDPHLELVITDNLDHEQTSAYDLTLTATDRGSPQQQSSSVTLRVNVVDVNDNPPVFDKQVYQLQLQENAKPGFSITTVHAEDADSEMFGNLRYFLPQTGNSQVALDLVMVDSITGEVTLKQSLDREKHNNLRVVIAARDLESAAQAKIGKTMLVIQVTDENDNAPTIQVNIIVESNGSAAFVSESSKVGTYIARISANDADYGRNGEVAVEIMTYMLPQSESASDVLLNTENYFALEDGSYIKTKMHLDRESVPQFLINIKACDGGVPSLCSTQNLTVILLDENDNLPVFSSPGKSIVLRENTDVGTVVSSVRATDRDSLLQPAYNLVEGNIRKSLNGVIRYKLHGGGISFSIDENSGKIRLVRSLDYETKKSWKLAATAWDQGSPRKSANITIKVDVINVNDNSPMFTNPTKSNQSVAATIQSGDVIFKINAVDDDEESVSEIRYRILSEDGSKDSPRLFILDKANGNLRLNMSNPELDLMVGSHNLQIKAQDSGTPPLYEITALNVQVYNVPLSKLPIFTMEVEEIKEGHDLTVVLISSLASAALLLVLILTLLVVCKHKNKKEGRSYRCEDVVESRNANHHLNMSGQNLNDMLNTTGDRLIMSDTSTFSSLDWKKNKDMRFLNKSQIPTKMKNSMVTDLSYTSAPPAILHVDRDSGRGDSDHDATSCDEKDTAQVEMKPVEYASSSLDEYAAGNYEGNMGPLCTLLCEQYGHSDACWMPRNGDPVTYQQPADAYQYVPYSTALAYNDAVYSSGLETISETQPLHSVLSLDKQSFETDHPQYSYVDGSRVIFLNSNNVEYHPSNDVAPTWSSNTQFFQPQYEVRPPTTSPYQYSNPANTSSTNPNYSVSEVFHDRCLPVNCSTSSPHGRSASQCSEYVGNSRAASVTQNPSLHEEHLPQRIRESHRHPSTETQVVTMATPRHGEVSMEETQQIIDNIDRLIDN